MNIDGSAVRRQSGPSRATPGQSGVQAMAATPRMSQRDRINANALFGEERIQKRSQQIEWVIEQWTKDKEKLINLIGEDTYDRTLREVLKAGRSSGFTEDNVEEVLRRVIADNEVQDMLHSVARCMSNWDDLTRLLLKKVLHVEQHDPNLMNGAKGAVLYATWAVASALRVAGLTINAVAATPATRILALAPTFAIPVLAIVHTVTMLRDEKRTNEMTFRNRASAYSNYDAALRFLTEPNQMSVADGRGFLEFQKAINKLPEFNGFAAHDADKTRYSSIRERYFLQQNILSATLGQAFSLLKMPSYFSAVFFSVSTVGYFGQGLLDELQADAELGKAEYLIDKANALKARLDLAAIAQIDGAEDEIASALTAWAQQASSKLNCTVLRRHSDRKLSEQAIERHGARGRSAKAKGNVLCSAVSVGTVVSQVTGFGSAFFTTLIGNLASGNSVWYMPLTAYKMGKRWEASNSEKHRQQEARIIRAMAKPEKIAKCMASEGGTLLLQVPTGRYREAAGFNRELRRLRVCDNESLSLRNFAKEFSEACTARPSDITPIISVAQHVWQVPLDVLWSILMVGRAFRDPAQRIDFIQHWLSPYFLTNFNVDASGREAPLPPQVLVQLTIDALNKKKLVNGNQQSSGATLYASLGREHFTEFDEDDFVAAVADVEANRVVADTAGNATAKIELQHVIRIAEHIKDDKAQWGAALLSNLRGKDGRTLRAEYGDHEVDKFINFAVAWFNAAPADRATRAEAMSKLSGLYMTQKILRDDFSQKALGGKLACKADLKRLLDRAYVDFAAKLEPPDDDEIITLSESDESDSMPDVVVRMNAMNLQRDEDKPQVDTGVSGGTRDSPSANSTTGRIREKIKRSETRQRTMLDALKKGVGTVLDSPPSPRRQGGGPVLLMPLTEIVVDSGGSDAINGGNDADNPLPGRRN